MAVMGGVSGQNEIEVSSVGCFLPFTFRAGSEPSVITGAADAVEAAEFGNGERIRFLRGL